jgi:HSP20 family protein
MIQHKMWEEFDNFRREMENVIHGWSHFPPNGSPFTHWARDAYNPHIRVYQDEDVVKVEAVIPGVNPESLALTIEDHTLILCGDKPRWAGSKNDGSNGDNDVFHSKERLEGTFKRSIALPVQVDADRTTAEYVHGVLRIAMPRAEATKPRKIEVAVG